MTKLLVLMFAVMVGAGIQISVGGQMKQPPPPFRSPTAVGSNTEVEEEDDLYTVKLKRQKVPVRTSENDAESAVSYYKSTYFGTISVGYPVAQEFSVVFDSGSGHVIVPSTHCVSEACLVHRRFDRNLSTSAMDVDYDGSPTDPNSARDTITIAFGTGEVNGLFVYDTVCLGPSAATTPLKSSSEDTGMINFTLSTGAEEVMDPRRCSKVRVVGATEMTADPFKSFAFDGVVGLGLESLALTPEFNFFGRISETWDQTAPDKMQAFAVFLADEREGEESEISFGGYKRSRLQPNSELAWTPVAHPEHGHWQIPIKSVRVGNQTLDFCNDGSCRAVVDTGTSLLAVPTLLESQLMDHLVLSGGSAPTVSHRGVEDGELDCSAAIGPDLVFDTGDFEILLTAGDYARQAPVSSESSNTSSDVSAKISSTGEEVHQVACRPTMMPIDMEPPLGPKLFIFGEPVLRRYYTVYHWKEQKVGFGLAQHRIPQPVTGSLSSRAEGLLPPLSSSPPALHLGKNGASSSRTEGGQQQQQQQQQTPKTSMSNSSMITRSGLTTGPMLPSVEGIASSMLSSFHYV